MRLHLLFYVNDTLTNIYWTLYSIINKGVIVFSKLVWFETWFEMLSHEDKNPLKIMLSIHFIVFIVEQNCFLDWTVFICIRKQWEMGKTYVYLSIRSAFLLQEHICSAFVLQEHIMFCICICISTTHFNT